MTFARHAELPEGQQQEVWECRPCKIIATEPPSYELKAAR
jgi:hypothetical protein